MIMQRMNAVDDTNSFVEDVRTELIRVTQNEDISQDEFIVDADLEAIWSRSRVHTLLKLCLCPEDSLSQTTNIVVEHYLKTISILIHIHWMQWPRFIEVFLGNMTTWNEVRMLGRNDDGLPFKKSDLKIFLGSYATNFDIFQWLFLPIRIGEHGSDYTSNYRLPVLMTEPLGSGASGAVYKETIAPGCLVLSSGLLNTEKIQVARKQIDTQEDFDSESIVIERLRKNLLSHHHITECYGVVVRQGRSKKKLDIFYELASSNLSQFFMNWGETLPSIEQQRDLLEQTSSLIDALVHCHENFFDREEGDAILAHNDLKPENILVFSSNPRKSLVGIWKIADFGLSRIKVAQDPNEASIAPRPPGAYTAPEIVRQGYPLVDSSSVQCDIWSLGCILAQVLVFAVRGPQAVKRFDSLRLPGNEFNYRDDRYFESHPGPEKWRLKRPLFQMLREICERMTGNDWVKQFVDLIFDILKVDKTPQGAGKIVTGTRLKASAIRREFLKIQSSQRSQLKRESVSTTITVSPPPSVAQPYPDPIRSPTNVTNGQRSVRTMSLHDESSIEAAQKTNESSITEPETSFPPECLYMKPSIKAAAINISCRDMRAVEVSSDATMVALWSNRQVFVYSLSSSIREQLFEHSLEAGSQHRINAVTIFHGILAITIGAPRSNEVRLFKVFDQQSERQRPAACNTFKLGETDHFRRVLIGLNDTVALVYSNYLRIGTFHDRCAITETPERWFPTANTPRSTNFENFKMIDLKSDTEYFFQPSISLDGKVLVVCSRDNRKSQVENWHFIDLSGPQEGIKDLVLPNIMPPPDLDGPTAPSHMVPLRNTVGIYYSTGDFALYEGTNHGCKLPRNITCAAATGSNLDHPKTQFLVYVLQNRKFFDSRTDIWCVELERQGGRVDSKKHVKLLPLPRKMKRPSLGFSWVKENKSSPRKFCVLVAFPEGPIWCLELPGLAPRWLD